MPEVYKESRVYREQDGDSSDDDDRYRSTTVRRYKVTPTRVERERVERVEEVDDDRRSRYSGQGPRNSGELLEVERRERTYLPERPRSAFDPAPRSVLVERQVVERERERDRDRDPYRDSRSSFVYEKEVERERERDPYRERDSRSIVYEKEVEREREPGSARDWDRRRPWDEGAEVRVEKRVERREDGDVKVEKRIEVHKDDHGGGDMHFRKETEYYSPVDPPPVPAPVIFRAPEQKIIFQEAPAPAPIILPRRDPGIIVVREQSDRGEVVRREPPREDEYYYRRESREVGPYRRDERELTVGYDHRRPHRNRDYASDGEDDDYYHVRRTVIHRDRSPSPSHKLHLAEGALAGAGVAALLASRRNKEGDLQDHRGRKVLAGAALGALGTEGFKRARSAYDERWGDDEDNRRFERDRGDHHSKLKTGLGIAAAALAVAGAAKYYQSQKIEKEEATRGRARDRRYSSSSEASRSRSRRSHRSRSHSVAKAALATAAAAGVVQHLRNKSKSRSKSRSKSQSHSKSKSRSRSRLRTAAELGVAGIAGGVASKLWKKRKDKKEREHSRDRNLSSDEDYYDEHEHGRHGGGHRSRSNSRSRSQSRNPYSESRGADPELGLVEYGNDPLPPPQPGYPEYGAGAGYESAADQQRRNHHRRHRGDDDYSGSEPDRGERSKDKKRSRSRLRDLAAAAMGTGAAAIGFNQYKKKKDKERDEEERRRDKERSRERKSRDRTRERDRDVDRDRERGRYEDDSTTDGYIDDYDRRPSPPMASGGAYYPPPNAAGPAAVAPPAGPAFAQPNYGQPMYPPPQQPGFMQHPNQSTANMSEYPAYNPQDYVGFPPPPPGPPPPTTTGGATGFPPGPPPSGPPPGAERGGPDHVSDRASRSHPLRDAGLATAGEGGLTERRERPRGVRPPSPSAPESESESASSPHSASKSVAFTRLSPQSTRTLARHRHRQDGHRGSPEPSREVADEVRDDDDNDGRQLAATRQLGRRRSSDPSSNRPLVRSGRHRNHDDSGSESGSDVEVLPDRFDAHGRPLDGEGRRRAPRWTSRSGEFEYRPLSRRNRRRPASGGRAEDGGADGRSGADGGGWNVRGAWNVGGTDPEQVERIVRDVQGVLEGRGGWMGLIRDVVGGLRGRNSGMIEDGGDEHGEMRRRRRSH